MDREGASRENSAVLSSVALHCIQPAAYVLASYSRAVPTGHPTSCVWGGEVLRAALHCIQPVFFNSGYLN
jgi:hypothetical protein